MNRKPLIGTGLAIGCLLIATASAADIPEVAFTVTKHVEITDIEYDEDYFDEKMVSATDRANLYDSQCNGAWEDVPCAISFARSGNIATFGSMGDGLDIIDSKAEQDAAFNQQGDIIVVDEIEYCGGFYPLTIGCGLMGERGFLVEKYVAEDVYIHEYGHNVDLEHTNSCRYLVMNEIGGEGNDTLTAAQCNSLTGRPYIEIPPNANDGAGGPLNYDDGPYWATADIIIPAGQTLTIEPGAEIQFMPGVSVKGALSANGRNGPIRMYSSCSTKHPCPRQYY